MTSFDLDAKLLQFGTGDSLYKNYCIKHSITGIACFGSTGSGKSSSMKTFALNMLRLGYGFLVLSAKSERETWQEYCRLARRSKDLILISPENKYRFDFMKFMSQSKSGAALTANLLHILKSVIAAGDTIKTGDSQDSFWVKSLDLLLYNTLSLNQLAYNEVSIQTMYDIIQSAPKGQDDDTGNLTDSSNENSAFSKAFETIRKELTAQYAEWQLTWTDEDRKRFSDAEKLESAILNRFPKARPFKFVEQFFFETFKTLSAKTKSIVLMSVSNFFFELLQDPIYTLFCSGEINVSPDDCYRKGAVIVLDVPTKHYFEAGRSAQLLFKLISQIQWETRNIADNGRPVCLWTDESSQFVMENDAAFLTTCRSSRISVVNICQSIHQYYASMGGHKSEDKVKTLLGSFGTKLFCGNSCVSSNSYAADLFGDTEIYDPSRSLTFADKFSQTDSINIKIEKHVRPEKFIGLSSGGLPHCMVEAYIHVQGDKLFNGRNFAKVRFDQNYR